MDTLLQDLRYGIRQLVRYPAVSAVAVVTLALGIGLNSVVYSIAHGLLRPLPVPEPERVVLVLSKSKDTGFGSLSYVDYRDLREGRGAFEDLAATQAVSMGLKGTAEDVLLWGEIVSPNYFDVLRIQPAFGRAFDAGRERDDAASIVVSHSTWRRRFGADPKIVGRTLTLNGHAFTAIGVAPPGFRGSASIWFAPEYWVSALAYDRANPASTGDLDRRGATGFRLIGRLRAGASVEQAQAQVASVVARLAREFPETNRSIAAVVLREMDTHPEPDSAPMSRFASRVFLALVGLVLLVASANVANLLLARAVARRKEMAVRAAIGGRVSRLVRQLLTEGLLLAALGGAAGLLLAVGAIGALQRIRIPTTIPVVIDMPLDRSVFLYASCLSGLATLVFGLAPALFAARLDLAAILKGEAALAGGGRLRPGRVLVIAQVGFALVLTVVAGLFARGASQATRTDWGLDPRGIVLATVDLGAQGYDVQAAQAFHRVVVEHLTAAPGVISAALAASVPLEFYSEGGNVFVAGASATDGSQHQTLWSVVGPGYFDAARTPIVAGRPLGEQDDASAPGAVVVNETFARAHWPGTNALGRTFALDRADGRRVTVVGIAKDGTYREPDEPARAYLYLPLAQNHRSQVTLVVRAKGDPSAVVGTIRDVVRTVDPRVPLFDVKTMDELIAGRALAPTRLAAQFAAVFGGLALILAMVGLFGIVAYAVSQRTREIGIRVAMGAGTSQIRRLVVGDGLRLAAFGGLFGLAGSAVALPVMRNLFVGVSPFDPLVFGVAVLALTAVALVASGIPAARATRIDPVKALRAE
jgi:predicted permease